MSEFSDSLVKISQANRVVDLERRETEPVIRGDFKGSVVGSWVKLDDNGSGVVQYNQKEYVTRPVGFTSIPSGTPVILTHADGVYFASW
jgi:hypothetical protein